MNKVDQLAHDAVKDAVKDVEAVAASPTAMRRTLEVMAIYEAAKGVAALAGVMGLLSLLHHDLHRLVLELIGHYGLDPHQHYPAVLLETVDRLNATPLHTLLLVTLAYVSTRWIEAWGLWHDKAWGEWFGALAGGVYVPFEVMHLMHHPTWQSAAVLAFNLALVVVLLWRLRQRMRQKAQTDAGAA